MFVLPKYRSIISASLRVYTSAGTTSVAVDVFLTVSLRATVPLVKALLQTISIAFAPSILFYMKFYLRKRMPSRVSS